MFLRIKFYIEICGQKYFLKFFSFFKFFIKFFFGKIISILRRTFTNTCVDPIAQYAMVVSALLVCISMI